MSSLRRSGRTKKQRVYYEESKEPITRKRSSVIEKSEDEKKEELLEKHISSIGNMFSKYLENTLNKNDTLDDRIRKTIRLKRMLKNGFNLQKNIQSSSKETYVRSDTKKDETYTIKMQNGHYVCNCGIKYDILKRNYCKHIMAVVLKNMFETSKNCLDKSSEENSCLDTAYLKFLKLNI